MKNQETSNLANKSGERKNRDILKLLEVTQLEGNGNKYS